MRPTFHDLETWAPVPIKNGTHVYAESAEAMIWAFADGEGRVKVWDIVNGSLHWYDEIVDGWIEDLAPSVPKELNGIIDDPEALVFFHNGGQFDFPVLERAMPEIIRRVPWSRRRDTMVQAYLHSMPGALDKLGEVLHIESDKRKHADGKKLVQLFCKPQGEPFQKRYGTDRATKQTHPVEWQRFIRYAGGDIITMREVHRILPRWNLTPKQWELWACDMRMNFRGFAVDLELAHGAVRASEAAKARLAKESTELTDGEVGATTQRDALLSHILETYGVELPDMRADTLERRLDDPDLPEIVKDLLRNRLQASMNSVSKYKTLLKGVNSDGRLRGCHQFRGAFRTGRWAHRMFQPANLPRPDMPQAMIDIGIDAIKSRSEDLVFDNAMRVISNTIRGAIVAPPGRKLVVSDLSNIEGRVAAWLAGEEWKLQAFRDYDTILPGLDAKGKPLRKGVDLYVKAYMASFNHADAATVSKDMRQIGKVEELMFQYGGGVGAWLTGAATYGIDLGKMTEQVWDTLPQWAKDEARSFLDWLYEKAEEGYRKRIEAGHNEALARAQLDGAKLKARFGLTEKVFIACDAIKRLWRKAHPQIASYWKEIEETIRLAWASPQVTFQCRKVKIRRSGTWLRVGLPSGRELCYPNFQVDEHGKLSYAGPNVYTKQWGRVHTYGGKVFENWVQAVACDQFAEPLPSMEVAGYDPVLGVHDEWVCETPDTDEYSADGLSQLMTMDLGWNAGLPLAAAGFETTRYRKE